LCVVGVWALSVLMPGRCVAGGGRLSRVRAAV